MFFLCQSVVLCLIRMLVIKVHSLNKIIIHYWHLKFESVPSIPDWRYYELVCCFKLATNVVPFPTSWMDPISRLQYRTQICQLPFTHSPTRFPCKIAGLLMSYTNCQIPSRSHSPPIWNSIPTHLPITPQAQNSVTPPPSILAPVALTIFLRSFLFYCWIKPQRQSKASPQFLSYQLSMGLTTRISHLR